MVIKMLQEDMIAEYQIRMIQENPTQHLLSLHKKQIDKDIYFYFDITSKITLNQLLKRIRFNKHKFLSILKSLIKTIGLGKQYLLQGGGFILHSDYIYVDPASLELSIAYMPIESEADINQEVRTLIMDLLIYKVAFETPAEGDFVYELLSSINSESFSLYQLDQVISNIALQQKQEGVQNLSTSNDLAPKSGETKEINIKSGFVKNYFKFILLQLSFAALAVLLSKYFYLQAEKHDGSTLIGMGIMIIALDILCVSRLRKSNKSAADEGKVHMKTDEQNKVLIPKKYKGSNKDSRFNAAKSKALKEYAAVKEHLDARDFETRFMLEETPKLACLVGYGNNDKEKILINKPSFVIGRIKSQSDYISSNSAVGKLHAEITNKDGTYYLKDLNSRNGTFINGERIVSNIEHPLQSNDTIAFANSEYKFLWS
jgi:hypothetical protein